MKKLCALFLMTILGLTNCYMCANKIIPAKESYQIVEKVQDYSSDGTVFDMSEEEDAIFQTQHYMSYYFKNLTENFGWNVKGSCGYVAMGMLLSYWDTYWNDNMIEEKYDCVTSLTSPEITEAVESPGIFREIASVANKNLSAQKYYQKVEEYSNINFHLQLIRLGNEQFAQYDFTSESNPAGMIPEEYEDLMNYYLYAYRGFNSNIIEFQTFQSSYSEDVRQYTINLLKQGIPVKVGISNILESHAAIAYDYDEENDEIYMHTGLMDGNGQAVTHATLSQTDYFMYKDAMAIIIKDGFAHTCSNNFRYFDSATASATTYCSCSLEVHAKKQTIIYDNITFGSQKARVIRDNSLRKLAPTTYQYGVGLNLSNITGYISTDNAYSPRMIFLGWFTDMEFTTPITNISTTQAGTVHLYAKWRYDYTTAGRIGTHVIDGTQFYTEGYDQIYIGTLSSQIADLKAMGMEYFVIKLKINMWETTNVTNQSQYIYIYDGYSQSANQLGMKHILTTTTTPGVQEMRFYIEIDDLVNLNYIYICYKTTSTQAPWTTDQMYAELMCVAKVTDTTSPEFYFADDDPFV